MARSKVRQIDIALKAGVSQGAVSAVLGSWSSPRIKIAPETAERVRRVAQAMQYRPNLIARQLKGQRSMLIGVLIGTGAAPVLFNRVAALESEAAKRGYRVLIGQTQRDPERIEAYVEDFASRRIDGLVCMTHEMAGDFRRIPKIVSRLDNVVFLRKPPIRGACYVDIDAADCIHQAVDHLVATGRRRIGMVILDRIYQSNIHRLEGYAAAMQRHGFAVHPELIWVDQEAGQAGLHEIDMSQAGRVVEHFIEARADAIVAINDDWAAQLLKAIKRRGLRIPEDISIVGQGNFKIARLMDPELTTLDSQDEVFARAAVDMLVDMIESPGGASGRSACVKPKLIIREST